MLLLASLLSGSSQQAPEPWYNVSIVQTVAQIIAAFVVLGIQYWLQRREKSVD